MYDISKRTANTLLPAKIYAKQLRKSTVIYPSEHTRTEPHKLYTKTFKFSMYIWPWIGLTLRLTFSNILQTVIRSRGSKFYFNCSFFIKNCASKSSGSLPFGYRPQDNQDWFHHQVWLRNELPHSLKVALYFTNIQECINRYLLYSRFCNNL